MIDLSELATTFGITAHNTIVTELHNRVEMIFFIAFQDHNIRITFDAINMTTIINPNLKTLILCKSFF